MVNTKRPSRWAAVFAFALCASCASEQAEPGAGTRAITYGQLDTGDPAVVAIAELNPCLDLPDVFCTGTLVAPRVVLTAAHCLQYPLESLTVFVGNEVGGAGTWHRAAALRPHPDYDRAGFINDIGAIVLGEDAAPTPVPVNTQALTPALVGADARIVGFGIPEEFGGDKGIKRMGMTTVSAVDDTRFEIVPNPAMTCQIDSGGPVLLTIEAREVVAGITSNGDPFCEEYAINTRVDVHTAGFLDAVIAEAATGSLTPPPPPGDTCPGCSILGCGEDETCDAETDTCVIAEPPSDWGCRTAGSSSRGSSGAGGWVLVLLIAGLAVGRRRSRFA